MRHVEEVAAGVSAGRLPERMRAARYATAGSDAGEIRIDEIGRPDPGPGEVLVAMAVSAVNPTDWKARAPAGGGDLAWVIPNQDGAGVIVAVGPGVDAARLGERVWLWQAQWQRAWGTAAEYSTVPAGQAVALPDHAPFELGATLGIPAMTAHRCLFIDGPLAPGDQVLVQGGAGAVGNAAIALAALAGARVAATVSGPEKAEQAVRAGAELVVDYRREDVVERVCEWAPSGVRRIVEVDLAGNLEVDSAVLASGGSIAVYARTEAPVEPPWALMEQNVKVAFILVYTMPDAAKRAAVEGVVAAVEAGVFNELPVTRFSLGETAAAHDAVRDGITGRALIAIGTATDPTFRAGFQTS